MKKWVLPLMLLLAGGCTHQEHLPTVPRTDEATTLAALARQGNLVRTVSGSGTLELTQPSGDSVRLDVAVVLQPPDRARIRAWKFGTAVFDLTVLPEGVWLEAGKDVPQGEQKNSLNSSAGPIGKAWSLLGGSFFSSPNLVAQNDGEWLIARLPRDDGSTVVCKVNRDTLTPREYRIVDKSNTTRFSLALGQYEDFAGILWPHEIVATSEAGKFTVDLGDVELNGEIPPLAFKPPRRAEKLP